jgi:hypothetical protein
MKKFINRIFRFIICFTIIAFMIGHLIETLIINKRIIAGHRYSFQGDWHDLANHNSDVVFVGNSRTLKHINPFSFTRKTSLSAELISQDGQRPKFLFYKFKTYLECNETPKVLVLQFDPYLWEERQDLYGIFNLLPYFYNFRINNLIYLDGVIGYKKAYHYIPLYAFFDNKGGVKLLRKIIRNKSLPDNLMWQLNKGYKCENQKQNFIKIQKSVGFINEKLKSPYIDSFFKVASERNIKLIGVFTPHTEDMHEYFQNIELLDTVFNKLSEYYSLDSDFIKYRNLGSVPKKFFYNHTHLNCEGTAFFMNSLLQDTQFLSKFEKY